MPPQVSVLPPPAARVHVLPPAHDEVQFDPQLPEHADLPSHDVVQPLPQFTAQVFFESQLYVTPLGAAPASPALGPSEQVPPDVQLHVVPEQAQLPVQSRVAPLDAPEQARASAAHTTPVIARIRMSMIPSCFRGCG